MADILITGGAGFIGSHLAKRLKDDGHRVVVTSLNKRSDANVIQLDLRDKAAVQKKLSKKAFDKVFNLTGYIDHTPFFKGGRAVFDQHLTATQNLVEFLNNAKLKSFIQVGSSDEYGNNPSPQKETQRENPIAPYSLGKAAASHFIQMISQTENFPGVVIRLFLVYGPGQDEKRFIPQIINGCLKDDTFKASEGKQLRDFCYVDDIVEGLIKASDTPQAAGEIFNLASGEAVAIRTVVEKIEQLCGGGNPQFGQIPYRPGENMSLFADVSKAKRVFNWEPRVSLEEGLKRTIGDKAACPK